MAKSYLVAWVNVRLGYPKDLKVIFLWWLQSMLVSLAGAVRRAGQGRGRGGLHQADDPPAQGS